MIHYFDSLFFLSSNAIVCLEKLLIIETFFGENAVFLLSCSRWLSPLLESIRTEIRKVYVFDLLSVTVLYACIRHVSHTKSFCIVFHYIYYAWSNLFWVKLQWNTQSTRHSMYGAFVLKIHTHFTLPVWNNT